MVTDDILPVDRPTVICLTPVKNEAWILGRFLRCASLWADHVIIADQGSEDGSQDIARSFPKVRLIENHSTDYSEAERQRLLLAAAREIPGPRLLVALDADEFITANFLESAEWQSVLAARPGTVVRFQWQIVLEDVSSYWTFPGDVPLGFLDDGSEHQGRAIHSHRIPTPPGGPSLVLNEVGVMHYVGIDPRRWRSRLRWYQCWETLHGNGRGSIEMYRFYNKDLRIPSRHIKPMPPRWLCGYQRQGIDMTSVVQENGYRWDREVLQMLVDHGPERFRKLAIWDVNWSKLYRELYPDRPRLEFRDPRRRSERLVHRWLHWTQPHFSHYKPRPTAVQRAQLRLVTRSLKAFGW